MQIGILEPEGFDPGVMSRLSKLGRVTCYAGDPLSHFLKSLDVLFVRLAYRIDGNLLRQAPKLQYLCSPTTGHTHMDESALADRRIKVISLRGQREFLDTIRATPEHTFGLILALLRRYKFIQTHVESCGWNRNFLRGEELYGNTVGIIGLGRVGFQVARYCTAFGANVVYCDTIPVTAEREWRRMPDILSVITHGNVIVLCASYANGTPPIVGVKEITALADRYFINTARGELVDESALLAAVIEDRLKGVAIDVVSGETGGNCLSEWRLAARNRNVIITPHIGGATVSSMARTEDFIVSLLEEELKVTG